MGRPVRGRRYLTSSNAWLERLVVEVLPFSDYIEACSIYAELAGYGLRADDTAFLCCNDRYFLLTAVLGRADMGHPWLYDRCREVEAAPDGFLDLWAREHRKTTMITQAGAMQEVLVNPDLTIGIFSHDKSGAAQILLPIKIAFEQNDLLRASFADIIWGRPQSQAPVWSMEKGITLRRRSNRREPTIYASGIIDGMPTGMHFDLRIYDDLITETCVTNPQIVQKVTQAWELSDNLSAGEGRAWHIGTRYCTIGSMQITMADWSQKPISEVQAGEEVVGWELRDGRRWLRKAKVINRGMHPNQPVNKYTFDHGRSVICTDDHKWWRGPHGGGAEYAPLGLPAGVRKDRPVKGHKANGRLTHIRELMVPCDRTLGRDAGWLAGMFDGEGTMNKNQNHPSAVPCITQTMHNPELIEEIRSCLKRLGFEWSESWWSAKDSKGKDRDRMRFDRCVFLINGGWRERYRFLRQIAPTKTRNLAPTLYAQCMTEAHKLVAVEPQADQDVYWLETETGNYIVDGFCSSNSYGDTYGIMLERGMKARIYPATKDGTIDGPLVYLSKEVWENKKKMQRGTLAAQMLQNPLAGKQNTFMPQWFTRWEIRPSILNIYIIVDPSGGENTKNDNCAMAVVGIDPGWNKYLLDGYCHRMTLSERWRNLASLYRKWRAERGVVGVSVGYEKYGMQSDIEYIKEKQADTGPMFEIRILNRVVGGKVEQSKTARIKRLEPSVRSGEFLFPALISEPSNLPAATQDDQGRWNHPRLTPATGLTRGDCYWHIDVAQSRRVSIPATRPTKLMRKMMDAGMDHRVVKSIRRLDQDRKPYDVTSVLIEEMLFFPFAPHDDILDAVSRIFDMDARAPDPSEAGRLEKIVAAQDYEDA